jgi:hypothetical protein
MYIKFCKCGRRILTIEQMKQNEPCELCQQEHADSFSKRMKEAQQEEVKND